MSCRFAGSPTPTALWRNIMQRKSLISAVSSELALPQGTQNLFGNSVYPAKAACLGNLYACVASEQNFPRQINVGENQDLFFATQLAFDALADAGMRTHANPPVKGCVHLGYAPPFNSSTVNWLDHTLFIDQTMGIIERFFPNAPVDELKAVRERLTSSLPAANADSFMTCTGHHLAVWISREAGFNGPSLVFDGGAISGTACIQAAVDALNAGRVDVALVGAISPPLTRPYLEGLSGTIRFSPANSLRPFDRDADGTLPGEGGAFFVLKRRADALNARDRIYALIRGMAFDSIAHSSSRELADLISTAAGRAGAPIKSIDLIEANGNGVPEDDAREIEAIQSLWGAHSPGDPLVGVGSVKGNIGNTLRASAVASILKTALALHNRVLPPQITVEHPIESMNNVNSSAYLLNVARPWITGDPLEPRRAAVITSAFDGGSCAMVLEEEPEART